MCCSNKCVVKHYYNCSPTGVVNPECCSLFCDWKNGKKCWGKGDRQCMKPGLCKDEDCSARPLPDGTRCMDGICLKGRCSKSGICYFLSSTKCDPANNSSIISAHHSCLHHCHKKDQKCQRAVLSDGKEIPLAFRDRCPTGYMRPGLCTLSHQCLLTDTRYVDWRRELSRSIPLFFHPAFLDETGKAFLRLSPNFFIIWILLVVFSSYSYVTFVYTDRPDVMNEIYEELVGRDRN